MALTPVTVARGELAVGDRSVGFGPIRATELLMRYHQSQATTYLPSRTNTDDINRIFTPSILYNSTYNVSARGVPRLDRLARHSL